MTSVRKQAARGVAWSVLQTWAVRLGTAAAFVIISRQLTPSEFGLVALAMSFISVMQLIQDTGMGTYLIRKESVSEGDKATSFWTGLLLSGTLSAALCLSAPALSEAFSEPGLAPLLFVLAASLLISASASVPTAMMRREMKFKTLAIRGTSATLVGTVVAVVLALLGAGAWALVIQSVVRALVSAVATYAAVGWWYPRFTWDRSEARVMLSFGSKLLVIDLMNQVRDRGEDFLIGGFAGTTALGYWSVAGRLVKILLETGTGAVLVVATPAFAKVQNDRQRLARALTISLYTSGAVILPAMLGLAVLSPDLVPLVLGQQWETTASVAQLVALGTAVATVTWFDRSIFIAVNKLRPEIWLVVSYAIIHIFLVVILVHNLLALAAALLIRNIIFVPIRAVVLNRTCGMPYAVYGPVSRVAFAALIMAGVMQGIRPAGDHLGMSPWAIVGSSMLIGVLVYTGALAVFARSVVRSLISDARSLKRDKRADEEPLVAKSAEVEVLLVEKSSQFSAGRGGAKHGGDRDGS